MPESTPEVGEDGTDPRSVIADALEDWLAMEVMHSVDREVGAVAVIEGLAEWGYLITPDLADRLAALYERMSDAIGTLLEMAVQADVEHKTSRSDHLRSKAQGVGLALSYLRETQRGVHSTTPVPGRPTDG